MSAHPGHEQSQRGATAAAERSGPPVEQGKRLATFIRGVGCELRLTLAEWEGNPYLALRVFECDPTGNWYPVKGKGCSIRLSEAAELARVLAAVVNGQRPPCGNEHTGVPDRPREAHVASDDRTAAAPPWRSISHASLPKRGGRRPSVRDERRPAWAENLPPVATSASGEPFDEFADNSEGV